MLQALLLANFERKYNSSSSLRVPKDVLELTTRQGPCTHSLRLVQHCAWLSFPNAGQTGLSTQMASSAPTPQF